MLIVACVAEKFALLNASCICTLATALSWHDEHTAAMGVILKLSNGSLVEAPVLIVLPNIPFAVGDAHTPVNWYDVLLWQAVQLFSLPGKTTLLKSCTLPPNP